MTNVSSADELHVVFGTGPLGRAVMRELVVQGKRVRMINRSGKSEAQTNGVEFVASDAFDPQKVRTVTGGATVVYQCAQPAYQEWVTKFIPLQDSIASGVAANGAKLIVAENVYMYGEVDGPIREDLPYHATTRKGKVRAEMAEKLLAADKSGKLRVAIGRGSDYFGPGVLESSLGARAIYPALKGKNAVLLGNIDLAHTFTYIDDFGKALVVLGQHDEALGQAWHVPNAESLTQRELMTLFFEEIGAPPKMSGMGTLTMRFAGIFIPGAREMVEMMYEFEKPFIVDSSKFEHAFGIHATPTRRAIKNTLAWYREHPPK